MKASTAKQTPVASALCRVCSTPVNGKGGRGLCARCYMREYRNLAPTPTPLKREPGTWKNVQAHIDLDVYEALVSAAKRARQSVPVWLQGAIEQRLKRGR